MTRLHTNQDETFEHAMMAKYNVTLEQLRHPDHELRRALRVEAGRWLRAKEREEREMRELIKLI